MDEQTAEYLNPTANDFAAFAAPPADESQIGDVYFNNVDEQTADFFSAPGDFPAPDSDAPILLGGGYEVAPEVDDGMGFAAPAPSAGGTLIEDVDDEEDAAPPSALVPLESSPMAKWNDEWQRTLLERKEEENSSKAEQVERARAEIAAFQADREKRREARMAKNRSDEQDKLEAIEADLENDNSWQRVVKMIELNQDSAEGSVDTGRMRDILVLMKNEPARAEALTA
ncbi:hypothetical protein ACHAW6_014751 [Cyclotella cf. meneghiniana]